MTTTAVYRLNYENNNNRNDKGDAEGVGGWELGNNTAVGELIFFSDDSFFTAFRFANITMLYVDERR